MKRWLVRLLMRNEFVVIIELNGDSAEILWRGRLKEAPRVLRSLVLGGKDPQHLRVAILFKLKKATRLILS